MITFLILTEQTHRVRVFFFARVTVRRLIVERTLQNGCTTTSEDKALDEVCFFFWTAVQSSVALCVLYTDAFRRGYDQVRADIESPKHLSQYKATKDTEDLPGLGKHYCVECSKWFESEYNLVAHAKGKNHKRRSVGSLYL